MKYVWTTTTAEETEKLAEQLGKMLQPGNVITLSGDLGAGKTTFTKALAAALGVTKTVNSPTFTIMKEYAGRLPFYHMDAYRLEDTMEELGLEEYMEGDGVLVIEWPEMIEDQLPEEYLALRLYYKGETTREIEAEAFGSRWEELLEEWKKA
ncbi:tRNA (adenosine(37)-N6)-threonylcarbamoyltransferase complex ATPase subunit type 1 TsaE [Alkalicoccus saliphilus]|jgi:tRNA threonylcarbamoyladenosine biosynthesis protein TsaE|uniref:tRNA threonylcarbamoyladenosine biosynthesis protein TsaE n=1 Tax=Alkalicoccus saliphilus TaxID=200989 RepID=A0A2T4U1Z6_9BACI|nr:tRNA (adenosine(37)-N6)-threonylcarbamoyltransferase complex ATPase subunit type 1 TsaE [Alkalicoccus saliphilus]PTL37418.1 tRNA (adenosine(37)-N6)-threonylcarbamoyltransferase complex ATPase subunit type 1 TsaE [Alkalicoccus saliphilus]